MRGVQRRSILLDMKIMSGRPGREKSQKNNKEGM